MKTVDGSRLSTMEQWRCPHDDNHVLGVMVDDKEKVTVKDRHIVYSTTRLIIFRNAVDLSAELPDEIEVAGVLDGKYLNMHWRCSICKNTKKWNLGREIVRHLTETYLAE